VSSANDRKKTSARSRRGIPAASKGLEASSTSFPNINAYWAHVLVHNLQLAGVECFCMAPGSRNTPLLWAVAELPEASRIVHFDERALAFYAVGRAKATGRPAVLICTSGTAAANFMPAVVEASMSRTPLLLLTADRPPELLDCGANQAIDQDRLFGRYARWYCELPCPEPGEFLAPHSYRLTAIAQAVYRATRAPAGPVHLNCLFREPLAPLPDLTSKPLRLDDKKPLTRYHAPAPHCAKETVQLVLDKMERGAGLLAIGALSRQEDMAAVQRLARACPWPVLPDIASGLRLGYDAPAVLHYHDRMGAGAESFKMPHARILHLGGPFVSKRFLELAASSADYIHVDLHPFRQDPAHCVTERIEAAPGAFAEGLLGLSGESAAPKQMTLLKRSSNRVSEIIDEWLNAQSVLTEIHIARTVSRLLPADSILFLGNSMPIRDMDLFGAHDGPPCTIIVNRGASGIDGNIATALGAAEASGKPATAILGDLAALHDLNALAMAGKTRQPFVLVVINNNGGGIFSFLPVADHPKHFETCIATPHGLSFDKAAAMFGLAYRAPATPAAFAASYRKALKHPGATLIEVSTNRQENRLQHRQLDKAIASALNFSDG